jgi:hypothetical protein
MSDIRTLCYRKFVDVAVEEEVQSDRVEVNPLYNLFALKKPE